MCFEGIKSWWNSIKGFKDEVSRSETLAPQPPKCIPLQEVIVVPDENIYQKAHPPTLPPSPSSPSTMESQRKVVQEELAAISVEKQFWDAYLEIENQEEDEYEVID